MVISWVWRLGIAGLGTGPLPGLWDVAAGNPDLSYEGEGAGWLLVVSFVPTGLGTRGTLRELLLPFCSPTLPSILGGHSLG